MSEVASAPDLWVSLQLDPLSVEHTMGIVLIER
jgi:hypothetical protein